MPLIEVAGFTLLIIAAAYQGWRLRRGQIVDPELTKPCARQRSNA